MKIRKGDKVRILSGKDRGKEGVVKFTLPKTMKVVVEGVNITKRHNKSKKNSQNDKPKGIVEFEAPIPMGKVMLIDPKTGKPTRVGFKIEKDKKTRISKKSNTVV